MKYVMFKKSLGTIDQFVPVIFPNSLVHADVSQAMLNGPLAGFQVRSAGEYSPLSGEVSGGSSTLGVKHDPGDEHVIAMNDYGGGFQ